jgi:hypothetical protein
MRYPWCFRSAVTIQTYKDEEKVEEPRRQINVAVPSLRETSSTHNVPVDQAVDPNYAYVCVGDQDGLGQGFIGCGAHDGAVDEQPVHQIYTMRQPVCVSASNSPAPGSDSAVRLASAASPQVHQPAELRQPQRTAQTTEATTSVCGFFPARTPVPASQLGPSSSAVSAAATADTIIQQINIQSGDRNVNPPKDTASEIQSGDKNDKSLLSRSGTAANTSVEAPSVPPIQTPQPPTQCGADKKAAENCQQILTTPQAADPVDLPAASGSSACDANLAMLQPVSDMVHQAAGIADATMSNLIGASSLLIEEKTSSSATNDEVTPSVTALTNREASLPHVEREPTPTVDDPASGTTAIPNSSYAPSHDSDLLAAPKSLIVQPASQETVRSVSPFQPVQASPILPPASTGLFDSKPSEVNDITSLVGSVDSVGLSPLTSLDLSGSFFRDMETKTALLPSPPISAHSVSAAESVSLEKMPRAIGTSSLESVPLPTTTDSSQLQHVPEASCKAEASPLVGSTRELRSITHFSQESTGSRAIDDPVAGQGIPRDFVDRNTAEANPVTITGIPAEDALQNPSITAVSGIPQTEGIKRSAVENDDKPSVEAATTVTNASEPVSVMEPPATRTTAGNEVRTPLLWKPS